VPGKKVNQTLPPPSFSRRRFLIGSAVAISLWPGSGIHVAQAEESPLMELRARAISLLDSCLAIDMHSHVGGSRHKFNDFSTIQSARLAAACLSLVSDTPVTDAAGGKIHAVRQPRPGELYANMLERLDFADNAINSNRLRRITTLAELKAAKAEQAAGLILATEGSDFLEGRLEHLEVVYARGVRHLQLVHYRTDNGAGDIQSEPPTYHGATPLGLDIVRGCNRLGIVVDVAHATFETVQQVAEVSSTPLILSHTSYAEKPGRTSRKISAMHARLIAQTGGVVGLWTNGSDFPDFAAFAQGLARMAEVTGVDHVGIGTDLHGLLHPMPFSYDAFPDLVAQLFKYFNENDLRKILGGNYLRVFDRVTLPKA
jgi:membrane dipeptidase